VENTTHPYTCGMEKTTQQPVLSIRSLDWAYPWNNSKTLANVSLDLNAWDFCFVVGKSGIGKTTLAKFIMRQLQPPKGTVFHNRDDIARYSSREIQEYRRKLWIVFQDCKLLDWKTVEENITYPLALEGSSQEQIDHQLDHVCELLWLDHLLHKKPPYLSGWEKQRVAIARALIRNPEFLIADEPTGNIDEATSTSIADKCIEINKEWTTILFITHDRSLISYVQKKHKVRVIEI